MTAYKKKSHQIKKSFKYEDKHLDAIRLIITVEPIFRSSLLSYPYYTETVKKFVLEICEFSNA